MGLGGQEKFMLANQTLNLLVIKKGECEEVVSSDDYGGEYHVTDFHPNEYDDKVILSGDLYKELFGKPRYMSSSQKKLLSVVKISTPDGQSIHRAFMGVKGVEHFDEHQVALSPNSIRLLTSKHGKEHPEYIHEVIVTRGSRFLYFLNHPYHATRISMRIGLIGIIVGLISIALTLYSCCCK